MMRDFGQMPAEKLSPRVQVLIKVGCLVAFVALLGWTAKSMQVHHFCEGGILSHHSR